MGYTLDFTNAIFDNQWHYVEIPLTSFSEYGSWDDDTGLIKLDCLIGLLLINLNL